jgi:chemotaxis protein methyltransferase CheR
MNAPTNSIPDDLYQRFSDLLLERCGLCFPDNRRVELEHGIRQAFASSTCATLDEFYKMLKSPIEGPVQMDLLINAVTISESHFFRDAAQFNALYTHVLPQIIERKHGVRNLRIWSAGCANGEEPYSLAIMLKELIPNIQQWAITILATDINTFSLERARKGSFGEWAFREERAKQLRSLYFRKNDKRYELVPEIRSMVSFARLNLMDDAYPSFANNTANMDLVICRNVTIYFNVSVTRWVVDHFYNALTDGGWLVVGHSEPTLETYQKFQARNFPDTVLYQRLGQPGLRAIDTPPLGTTTILQKGGADIRPIPASSPQHLIPSQGATQKLSDLLEQAGSLLEYGRSEEACSLLLKLAATHPTDSTVSLHLARAHANLGNWLEAEKWARCTFELDKLALEAYYLFALVMQHQGRLAEAIDAMKKVVYLDRLHILGHYGLANLYHESGLLPQAQKALENALKLLQPYPENEMVPGSQGITANRLKEAIVCQQQAWSN